MSPTVRKSGIFAIWTKRLEYETTDLILKLPENNRNNGNWNLQLPNLKTPQQFTQAAFEQCLITFSAKIYTKVLIPYLSISFISYVENLYLLSSHDSRKCSNSLDSNMYYSSCIECLRQCAVLYLKTTEEQLIGFVACQRLLATQYPGCRKAVELADKSRKEKKHTSS